MNVQLYVLCQFILVCLLFSFLVVICFIKLLSFEFAYMVKALRLPALSGEQRFLPELRSLFVSLFEFYLDCLLIVLNPTLDFPMNFKL